MVWKGLIDYGGYGYVHQYEKDGKLVALKVNFNPKELSFANGWREIDMLTRLAHPFVVKLVDVVFGKLPIAIPKRENCHEDSDMRPEKVYLVFELGQFDLNNRDDFLESGFDLGLAMTQCLLALEYMHEYNHIHLDIKPGNIVYFKEQKCCKLIDFGFTMAAYPNSELEVKAYTRHFRPPELIKGDSHYTTKADVWAMGMTWLYMLMDYRISLGSAYRHIESSGSGHSVKNSQTLTLIDTLQPPDQAPMSTWNEFLGPHFSEPLYHVLSRMLVRDPAHRASCTDLLSLPYFDTYRDVIDQTRLEAKTLTPPLQSYVITSQISSERDLMLSHCKPNKYLTQRIIFHAMDAIDQYINWRVASEIPRPPENISHLRARSILYLYYKFFNTLAFCYSYKFVFGMKIDFPEPQKKIIEEWEWFLVKEILHYRVYRTTLFELAKGQPKKLSEFYALYCNADKIHNTVIE